MLFKDVIGQDIIKQQLVRTVTENRLSHALLFAGPEGCGKLPMALALAQYLNCTSRLPDDACGQCPSCHKFAKLVHPDLHFVFPVVKSSSNSSPVSDTYIKEWREFAIASPYFNLHQWFDFIGSEKQGMIYTNESAEIIKKLSLKTFEGQFKIMVIWHPELMHESAANKLLKLIEEPPSQTQFILVSDTPGEILGTILSRTQQVRFARLPDDIINRRLVVNEHIDASSAQAIAKLSNGNYIRAVEVAGESEEQDFFLEQFKQMMRMAYGRKIFDLLELADVLVDQSKERQKNFLLYALRMVRENYFMNLKRPAIVYLTPEEENFSGRFSPFINDRNVVQISDEVSLAHAHLEQNGNPRIVFTDLMIKLIVLLK
ncbi:MAG: DNA polymerase III subunit [Breznakibacter sp.]